MGDCLLPTEYCNPDGASPCLCAEQVRNTPLAYSQAEIMLISYTALRFIKSVPLANKQAAHVASLSILLSPGLLIIDHIHFQYNGFMYGILILSLVLARKQLLASGFLFAALLCFKHIYLYLSLAYFVYLLRAYCLDPKNVLRPRFLNITKLGICVVGVFGIAFGPFADQLPQLKDRLFPFSRGLCHAYWAPNFWAMYSFIDRALIPREFCKVPNAALLSYLTFE